MFFLLFATGLVFLMQAGFTALEAGLTRPKNSINVAIKNLADFAVATILFWAVGYGLMFGSSKFGLVGTSGFALDASANYKEMSFFLFQLVFCGTAATIVSGAIAERAKFGIYLLISALVSVVIYPIVGHAIWNPSGFLAENGFRDFAGSTVVHSVGGWVALAGVITVGARVGRFEADGTPKDMRPWSLPMSVLGCLLLCFGWIGFNGGSTFALTESIPLIVTNTILSAAAGGLTAMALGKRFDGLVRAEPVINGLLAGLVGITAACNVVTPLLAIVIGMSSAAVMVVTGRYMLTKQLDDVIGAVPVHLAAGIWGTLCVGLFGDLTRLGTGLTRVEQILAQLGGIAAAGVWALGMAIVFFKVVGHYFGVRVSEEDEILGLNMAEHGECSALHEFLSTLERTEKTGDLSERVPEDPYSEVGQIAHKYNGVLDAVEKQATEIRVAHRETEDILLSIGEGLIVVDESLCIGAQHSRAACTMLGQDELTGLDFLDTLLPDAESTGQEKIRRQLASFLSTTFALFMVEQFEDVVEQAPSSIHFRQGDELCKYLLSYAPMAADDEVVGVVIVLSDATELERLQNSAGSAFVKVADMFANLATVLEDDTTSAALRGYINEILPLAQEAGRRLGSLQADQVEEVFRNVHTIKGGARLFQLDHLQHFAHEIEDVLGEVRSGRLDIAEIEKTDLGKHMDLLLSSLHTTLRVLDRLQSGTDRKADPWEGFSQMLSQTASRDAAACGKAVSMEVARSCPLDRGALTLIQTILPHMVRNSIDHGVEIVELRRDLGKDPVAAIHVELHKRGDEYIMTFTDDGSGVNVEALQRKAIDNGEVEIASGDWTNELILDTICAPGLSLASSVSKTSGRGVGMDAVRDAIRASGGELSLENDPGKGLRLVATWPADPGDDVSIRSAA